MNDEVTAPGVHQVACVAIEVMSKSHGQWWSEGVMDVKGLVEGLIKDLTSASQGQPQARRAEQSVLALGYLMLLPLPTSLLLSLHETTLFSLLSLATIRDDSLIISTGWSLSRLLSSSRPDAATTVIQAVGDKGDDNSPIVKAVVAVWLLTILYEVRRRSEEGDVVLLPPLTLLQVSPFLCYRVF